MEFVLRLFMLLSKHLFLFLTFLTLGGFPSLAQAPTPTPSLLDLPAQPHPNIPLIDRPLSPLERRQLAESLEVMNQEALAQLQSGNQQEAFNIWYEELRLRRYLGPLSETQALGRVGAEAWNRNRTQDVRMIIIRLRQIEQQATTEKALQGELLNALATSYEQLHSFDDTLSMYQRVLETERAAGNLEAQENLLNKIGQTHLARFDYAAAAPVYEELLKLAQARGDALKEGLYLQRLAEIYSQALQPENAVKIKESLVESYLKNQKIQAIPELKILIGIDYEALKQLEKASQNYQEAYSLAWALQQYGTAGEALKKLGELYKKNQQEDFALQIFNELIKVNQTGYNYYGLMNTYDSIGEIYMSKKSYSEALSAFQKGLELARSIRHKEDYFVNKINQANQQMTVPQPEVK
jgi:tetratricopeptide (TPR) repeat protein